MSDITILAHMETHAGNVRQQNEDCCDLDTELGYFAVFDGMGGHNAGDVASQTARDVVREYLSNQHQEQPDEQPENLIRSSLDAAAKSIYTNARSNRELHGMGTTAVVCIVKDFTAIFGHSGDSRGYLLRSGKLRQITRDHTVVAELMSRGALSADEAQHHPYKSVLSRNLGGKPTSGTDINEVELQAGDRILLCSDGLTGFAAIDAIEHVLSGAENPRAACTDLIELALRGGGGDNVTVVVLEVGTAILPEATQILRTSGASDWWDLRDEFLKVAANHGVAKSPICVHLPESEALELIVGNVHEALYHDLEQTTGIHLWTFSENLAMGWLDANGHFSVLRELIDNLREAALESLQQIAKSTRPSHLILLKSAIQRALVVVEMAITGIVAERIRRLEAKLAARRRPASTTELEYTDQRTIPFMTAAKTEPASPQVAACLDATTLKGHQYLAADSHRQARECLELASNSAANFAGEQDLLPGARELIGKRELSEAGFTPLIRSLEQARFAHLEALARASAAPEVAAAVTRRIARAHHALAMGVAFATIDLTLPIDEDLRLTSEATAALRAKVARGQRRITQLERQQEIAAMNTIINDDATGGQRE